MILANQTRRRIVGRKDPVLTLVFENLGDDPGGDRFRSAREAIDQCRVAQDIDGARDAAARLRDQLAGIGRKQRLPRAGDPETVFDIGRNIGIGELGTTPMSVPARSGKPAWRATYMYSSESPATPG
jgi:hypothetical protein